MNDSELREAVRRQRAERADGWQAAYAVARGDGSIPGREFDLERIVSEYLREHPADDGEPVTANWPTDVVPGFNMTSNMHLGGCMQPWGTLMAHRVGGVWRVIARTERGEASLRCDTRGDLRRLCAALGIPLRQEI